MIKKAIVWFRNDLRINDNESITEANRCADEVIPVYIFDERIFQGKTKYGFRKTGVFRARFIIEAVQDLRTSLKNIGSNLIVRIGIPEEILFELAFQYKTSWVFCNRERTQEEMQVQDNLERKLWSIGQEMRYNRGKMLYYTADLPFPITHTPDAFSTFRKEVEKYIPVRMPLEAPENLEIFRDDIEVGKIPSLEELGYSESEIVKSKNQLQIGGESEGLKRLQYYLWDSDLVTKFKETKNELLGSEFSSKFSAYLSQGCLSPKIVYHEIKKYESLRTHNESTYWLVFELIWRDFYRLMGKKHGNNIFKANGPKNMNNLWSTDMTLFDLWAEGKTGIPFIDANMIEINQTGYMSNRGRQNVASFLINDLGLSWVIGAEYFESLLIDYDPCSNYGNWNYLAGVGSDSRDKKVFNVIMQAKKYDPEGHFIKRWIPAFNKVPVHFLYTPDEMLLSVQIESDCVLGKDYPLPVVTNSKWL